MTSHIRTDRAFARSTSSSGGGGALASRALVGKRPKSLGNSHLGDVDGPRWDLAFLGILAYMFVEYTRLEEMYPALQHFAPAKVLVGVALVGLVVAPRPVGGPRRCPWQMDVAMICFLLGCLGSALFADDRATAFETLVNVIQWATIYFLLSRILTGSWRQRIFVLLLLLLCLKLSQFEIRDYFGQRAFGRSEEFLDLHGVGAGSTGFFGNGGDFGVAMCVVWPLAGSLFWGNRRSCSAHFC